MDRFQKIIKWQRNPRISIAIDSNLKRIIHSLGLILLIFLFLYACVTPGKKEYDIGMQLSSAGKYKEAIAYLNQAIEKEPNNKIYQKSLADLKETQVTKFVAEGSQALGSQSPVNIGTINRANDKLTLARGIAPDLSPVQKSQQRFLVNR